MPLTLVDLVNKKVDECYAKARKFFNMPELLRCEVEFGLTGLRAGTANYTRNRIRINSGFLLRECVDMIEDTVPHEVAHLVTYRVFSTFRVRFGYNALTNQFPKLKPHGSEWRLVMEMVLGVPATRCHKYAIVREAGRYQAGNPHSRRKP